MYTERKVGIAIIDKCVDKSVLFIISYPWTECNHRKKKAVLRLQGSFYI